MNERTKMIVVITTITARLLLTFNINITTYSCSAFLLPSKTTTLLLHRIQQRRHRSVTAYHYFAYSGTNDVLVAAAEPITGPEEGEPHLDNAPNDKNIIDNNYYRAFDLLLARKIRKSCCGSKDKRKNNVVDRCLQLLEAEIPNYGHNNLYLYEESFLVALDVCSKAKRYDAAIELFEKHCSQSERCLTKTISICGKYGQHKLAIELLFNNTSSQTTTNDALGLVSSYNAAIAACAKSSATGWEDALLVFNKMMEIQQKQDTQLITTLTCNAVLTAISNAGRGTEALEMLQKMISSPPSLQQQQQLPKPDRLSFHKTMTALIKNERLYDAYQLLGTMIKIGGSSNGKNDDYDDTTTTTKASQQLLVLPNNQTYDILSSAYGKSHNWTMVRKLEKLRYLPYYGGSCKAFWENGRNSGGNGSSISVVPAVSDHRPPKPFARWDHPAFIKLGKGKFAYWEIGTYECGDTDCKLNMTVALQPNRNPRKNGMKIMLLDGAEVGNSSSHNNNKKKIGFLLMINSSPVKNSKPNNNSQLLGMYLDEKYRKRALSKVMLAIWLDLCCRANLEPITGVINKPLLALVLQNTFGFVPMDNDNSQHQPKAVDVEISRGEDGAVELYSSSCKNLQGAFAAWDLKRENIRLVSTNKDFQHRKEEQKGGNGSTRSITSCRVGAALELGPTVKANLVSVVQRQLKGPGASEGRLLYNSLDIDWTKIMIGH